jgi:hypothetical protein
MATHEQMARACAEVMGREGISLERLKDRAPRFFWERVATLLPEGTKNLTLANAWARNREKLSMLIQAELDNPGRVSPTLPMEDSDGNPVKDDNLDYATALPQQDTKSANCDNVDHDPATDDNLPIPANHAKLDILATIATLADEEATGEAQRPANIANLDHETRLKTLEDKLQTMSVKLDNLASIPNIANVANLDSLVELANIARVDQQEDPPLPKRGGKSGKRLPGEKRDIRARIDRNLYALLEKDCKERYGGNWSHTFDAVIWRAYGKPHLSFEEDTATGPDED